MKIFANPVITDDQGLDHGDPFVMEHRGSYYLYHTGQHGIHLYTSADLVDWEYRGVVLQAHPSPEHGAQIDFWAPEVMHHEGTFYMYVAATRKRADGLGDDYLRRQWIARSASPLGPFQWDAGPLVPEEWSIDGHPYRDDDGQLWFFYNVRTDASRYWDGTTGCGNVVDRMLAPDRLEGAQSVVAFPNKRWEGNRDGTWYWNEGPCVLKRRGVYYQMYSGGFYADDTYGVGFATAPSPRGPWTKHPGNPILRSGNRVLGPGHHSVVLAPDGVTPYMIYHAYVPGQRGRKVFIDRLFWAGDRLVIAGPTGGEQECPPGPVFDPAVPHRVGQASHLDDERVYELPDGASQVWTWGGTGPLELSVAVRGRAALQAGAQQLELDAVGDRFTLIRLWIPNGAREVRVVGGAGGATVTDLVLTARG